MVLELWRFGNFGPHGNFGKVTTQPLKVWQNYKYGPCCLLLIPFNPYTTKPI